MTSYKSSKINKIMRAWPQGTVATSTWLEEQGAYQQLVFIYEKTSWIQRIGHGAFIKAGDKVTWLGGLYALQHQLGLSIHAGAKTALELHGFIHFLPLGKALPFYLFAKGGQKLPSWFKNHDWGSCLKYKMPNLFSSSEGLGMTQKSMGSFTINVSTPERAIIETLYLVPHEQSFEEAHLLMEKLRTLRPQLVQKLLKKCQSIKTKRLFMYLATQCNHSWAHNIDLSKINFGSGYRQIVKGGRLDKKFKITVPKTKA